MNLRLKIITIILVVIAAIVGFFRFIPQKTNNNPERNYFMGVDGDPRMRVCQSAIDAPDVNQIMVKALKINGPLILSDKDKAIYRISVFHTNGENAVSIEFKTPKTGAPGIVNIAAFNKGIAQFETQNLIYEQALALIDAFQGARRSRRPPPVRIRAAAPRTPRRRCAGGIVVAHVPAHERGDLLQHVVAGDVAVAVVDRLEQVHVDDAHGQFALMPHCAGDLLLHRLDEVPAVVHLRQRIVGGELVDLLVLSRFHAAVADELQDALAQRDVVAIGQHRFGYRRVVDAGGVGGAGQRGGAQVLAARDERLRATAWALVGCMANLDTATDDEWFASQIPRIERSIHTAPAAWVISHETAGIRR